MVASKFRVNLLEAAEGSNSGPNLSAILRPGASLNCPPSSINPLSFGLPFKTFDDSCKGASDGPLICPLGPSLTVPPTPGVLMPGKSLVGLPLLIDDSPFNLVPIFLTPFKTSSDDKPFNLLCINFCIFGLKCALSIAAIIPLSPAIVF